MKKRISCILAAALLIFALAACGASGEKKPEKEYRSVSFETTDLDGNAVSSADVFGAYKITMVNLWGTYCGPCIREMPDLQRFDESIKEIDCAVVGIVVDVSSAKDTAMVKTAEAVIEQTGVKYLNLVYWDGLLEDFPAQFIPTTYFVDSEGRVVGGPVVGSMAVEDYQTLLDEALREVK